MSTVRRWDHLKRAAQDIFNSRCQMGYPFPTDLMFLALTSCCAEPRFTPKSVHDRCQEWSDYGNKLIDNWDIRKCMKLVECFPGILPKHLQTKVPVCDYDERGNWALFFD